ncbi:FadR family transcriptional regulator [bacterium]|nr:MAG: FadR family transcriptional regulator [bacterium]
MTTTQFPQSKPLYEQVVELIEARIISGEYRLGDQLPTEFEMAAQYRVSRTVIREAMKTLKERGWVDTRVGKGTFLVDNVSRGVGASFDVIVRMNPDLGFEHLIEVRELIEPGIAALAAVRASDQQIQAMRAAVEKMENAIEQASAIDDFLTGDYTFHTLLAQSTGNPLVPSILEPVVTLMRDQQKYHLYRVKGGSVKSQNNHRLIMEAIENRDPEAARQHMLDHIRQVRADVQASNL